MSVELIVNVGLIIGNMVGILYLYHRIEKRVDKKINFYVNKGRNSKEGKMIAEIIEEVHKTVKSEGGKALLKEMELTFKESRGVLQRLSLEPSEDEEGAEEPVLPSLRDTHG